MAISANTLFHFTKNSYLKSIIKDGFFLPRYSFEMFNCQEKFIVAYPMVSFCDISLSQIYEHANVYNKNGIGLSKVWGHNKKINPVLYIQEESYVHDILVNLLNKQNFHSESGETYIKVTDSLLREKILKLFELSAFFKPSKGKIWNRTERKFEIKKSDIKKISRSLIKNFYNEREWRFVPNVVDKRLKDNKLIPINFIPEKYFLEDDKFSIKIFNKYNSDIEKFTLPFKPVNVKYIIVENLTLMNELVEFIEGLENYLPLEKNQLITKIITLKQIKEDF